MYVSMCGVVPDNSVYSCLWLVCEASMRLSYILRTKSLINLCNVFCNVMFCILCNVMFIYEVLQFLKSVAYVKLLYTSFKPEGNELQSPIVHGRYFPFVRPIFWGNVLWGTEVRSPRVWKISDSTISSQSEGEFDVIFLFSKPDSIKTWRLI